MDWLRDTDAGRDSSGGSMRAVAKLSSGVAASDLADFAGGLGGRARKRVLPGAR